MSLQPFRPRFFTSLKGYSLERLIADVGAGFTVGIVALPLAMAFAIASGVNPAQGIWTAVIGCLIVSLLGGSSVQIAGPAGAFIVVVYDIVLRLGYANLVLITLASGVLLFLLGLLRLGTLVRFVPVSIVIGFTNAIAVTILITQIRDAFGLSIAQAMPSGLIAQIKVMWEARSSINFTALLLTLCSIPLLLYWQNIIKLLAGKQQHLRFLKHVPAQVIVLILATLASILLPLPVETIGTRFGEIPSTLPALSLPTVTMDGLRHLVTPTLTLTILGAIESLLCARVADSISTKTPRHEPNQELMAQGIANFVVPFFGGIPITGTIARTVTNVRCGATSPLSGIVHSAVLAVLVLIAAPLAKYTPLAALAAILVVTALRMGEWHEFIRLFNFSGSYRILLLSTFFLTIVFDLSVAVEVGLALAFVFFVNRMGRLFRIDTMTIAVDAAFNIQAFRLYGALFFAAVNKVDSIEQALAEDTRYVILDCSMLMELDTSGIEVLEQFQRNLATKNRRMILVGLHGHPASIINRSGFAHRLGEDAMMPNIDLAILSITAGGSTIGRTL